MKKTLYLSDLDGTLLNSKSQLDNKTILLLNEMVENGLLFSYATARSLVSAKRVTNNLSLRLPVILNNGVFINDLFSNQRLLSAFFSQSDVSAISDLFERNDISPLVYSFGEKERVTWLRGCETPGLVRYLESRPGDPRFVSSESIGDLYSGNIFYFTAIGEEKDLSPLFRKISNDRRFSCYLQKELYTDDYWLEVFPPTANKGNAAAMLKQILGCDRLVCFGDHLNDLAMFAAADLSIAPSNAENEVKKAADLVIGSNDENSVALWLSEHAEFRR